MYTIVKVNMVVDGSGIGVVNNSREGLINVNVNYLEYGFFNNLL